MTLPYVPRADSLAAQVINFFKSNPDESLLLDDIQEKFTCTRGNIHTLLKPAVEAALLFRGQNDDSEWLYAAGPKLQANAHTVPEPVARAKPPAKGHANQRHNIDINALVVEDHVPVMAAISAGQNKWEPLFKKLTKPGQSVAIPGHIKGALAAAIVKRNKQKQGVYRVAMTAPAEARVWRVS